MKSLSPIRKRLLAAVLAPMAALLVASAVPPVLAGTNAPAASLSPSNGPVPAAVAPAPSAAPTASVSTAPAPSKVSAQKRKPPRKRPGLPFDKMLVDLLKGLLVSSEIFFLTILFSLPLGLAVAFGRMARFAPVQWFFRIYISVMRGTPLMLQLFFFYFGPYYLFKIGLTSGYRFIACIIAFSLNYAAYFAEIYRAGIEAIPVGQYEAGKVLGFTRSQTFLRIVLPQVVKRILPPVTNEVITLVKDTSLAFTLSVMEMFTCAKMAASAHTTMTPFIVAGVFYYIFNFIVAWAMERIEKSLGYYR